MAKAPLCSFSPTNTSVATTDHPALTSVASIGTLTLNYGVIPEPSTLLLLGAGVTALAIGRKRMA